MDNSLKENSGWFPPSHKFTQILPYHASSNSDPARTFSAAPSCHVVAQDTLTVKERPRNREKERHKSSEKSEYNMLTSSLLLLKSLISYVTASFLPQRKYQTHQESCPSHPFDSTEPDLYKLPALTPLRGQVNWSHKVNCLLFYRWDSLLS